LEPHIAILDRRLKGVSPADTRYQDAQLPLHLPDAKATYHLIEKVLGDFGVLDLVRSYLPGALGRVKAITLQKNRSGELHWKNRFADMPDLKPSVDYLHVDTGNGVLKAILYISEVGRENGAFSYIIGSNRRRSTFWDRIIRSANDYTRLSDTDPASRRMFNALPRSLQRKANFGFDIVDDSAEHLKSKEQVFTSDMGDLLIFDNYGAHRGGMVESGERAILQIILW
jgi:hypothetical protein